MCLSLNKVGNFALGPYNPPTGGTTFAIKKSPDVCLSLKKVGDIGLEPTTFAMSTQRSNQLS